MQRLGGNDLDLSLLSSGRWARSLLALRCLGAEPPRATGGGLKVGVLLRLGGDLYGLGDLGRYLLGLGDLE